jgi:hypothetical protein
VIAVRALATWALDLVERDVGNPDGARRVRNARRLVLARLDGKPAPRGVSIADVRFTALRLARRIDHDLQLGIGEHLDLIEALDQRASSLIGKPRRPGKRESTDLSGVAITRLPPGPIPELGPTVGFAPPRLRFCEHCGLVHEESDHVAHRTYP